MGHGPPGCRQTTTMAEEIVSCCTSTLSLSTDPRRPRFPDRARRIPVAWGPRLVPAIPATASSNKRSSSNRPTCVRSRVQRISRAKSVIKINRLKATSMSGPEWSIGTRNPRRSLRSTSPSAERVVRRVASALGIIRLRAVSMGAESGESGTRRPWTSLVSIIPSVERVVVRRVASVSDIIRSKAIRPMAREWPSGTRSHPTSNRSISPSAPSMVDNRVASVSGIIKLRRSVSPPVCITVRTVAPIVSRDSTISARCTASNGFRVTNVTRSAIRSCTLTQRARVGRVNTRTRTRSSDPSPRRRSRRHRRQHQPTTASSRHRHCHPVRARSMPRARAWLVILLLIAFCPPILRGPSMAPTAPLQHRRCPPRSVSPPPSGCWPLSNQLPATLRINNATLDHLIIVCFRGLPRSWKDFRRDFRAAASMPRTLATPPFPRTGYCPPRQYTLRYQRDSSASRKDTWPSRPFTIDILDRIRQRQHLTSGIRRLRRPLRGEFNKLSLITLQTCLLTSICILSYLIFRIVIAFLLYSIIFITLLLRGKLFTMCA